jgi:cytochrome c-type biogenesis protein CcsB
VTRPEAYRYNLNLFINYFFNSKEFNNRVQILLLITIALYITSSVLIAIYHLRSEHGATRRDRQKKSAKIPMLSKALLWAGFISHSLALAIRTIESGHAPMASIYETLLFYSWTVTLVSLIVINRYKERVTELITIPMATFALLFSFFNERPAKELTLILRTRWFETHVISSFAAYALFTLSFSSALFYLYFKIRKRDEEELRNFQSITSRAIMWGFLFFSASMFAGAIWGYLAWGTYWMWEPKIIWSFIVWFFYAGAMHAYYVKEWRGTGLNVATIIGFFVVLFTYLGVGLLMKSSHSF